MSIRPCAGDRDGPGRDSQGSLRRTPTGGTASPGATDAPVPATTVCLVVSNSFAPRPGTRATPGMPVELTVDVVASSPAPAAPDLGRGWVLLALLTLAGLLTGLLVGLLTRWWVATWRQH